MRNTNFAKCLKTHPREPWNGVWKWELVGNMKIMNLEEDKEEEQDKTIKKNNNQKKQ